MHKFKINRRSHTVGPQTVIRIHPSPSTRSKRRLVTIDIAKEYCDPHRFANAYLIAKRRHTGDGPIRLAVIRDKAGKDVDFGNPSDWKAGVAGLVLRGVLSVDWVEFVNPDAPVLTEQKLAPLRIPLNGHSSLQHEKLQLFDLDQTDVRFMEGLECGSFAIQGQPDYMEDRHFEARDFDDLIAGFSTHSKAIMSHGTSMHAFFGVYDGHGGTLTAEFVQNNLHLNLAQEMAVYLDAADLTSTDRLNLSPLIHQSCYRTEVDCLSQAQTKEDYSGAVSAFVLFRGKQVTIAHAGDCRVVLCRDGETVQLTNDHKPNVLTEKERVEHAGGFIEYGLLNGWLSVTRGFGDRNPEDKGKKVGGLTAEHELLRYFVQTTDEFMIIACDGLWDVVSNTAAVTHARHSLRESNDTQKAAEDLANLALSKGSDDNITVTIIGFGREDPTTGMRSIIGNKGLNRFGRTPERRARTGSLSPRNAVVGASALSKPFGLPPPQLGVHEDASPPSPPRQRPKFNFSALKKALQK